MLPLVCRRWTPEALPRYLDDPRPDPGYGSTGDGPAALLPGEDDEPVSLEDLDHWYKVYGQLRNELAQFVEQDGLLEFRGPLERTQQRLRYWERKREGLRGRGPR